jgi:glycosyltransferase involved in cell wall biosynthesis
MTLRLVYRSYGGENLKQRPFYYSKMLALISFVRAATELKGAELLFLNDGPIPNDKLAVMRRYGRVAQTGEKAKGMRASYRAALDLVRTESWTDDDVVCYVEDDYLFMADAFIALAEAVPGLPDASYFSLYGNRPNYDDPLERIEHGVPRDWKAHADRRVGDRLWFNRASITSTFAARVGILREDLPIFIQCLPPFLPRRILDHETCLLYQGFVPYHGWEFFFGLPGDFQMGLRGVVRGAVLVPFRIALNLRAYRQRTPHLLYTVTPNLATHLEHPVISPDRDWVAIAEEVAQWAEDNRMDAPSSAIRERLSRVI